ncbi:MAG: hypothetical protein L3J69_06075 [Desulfobacula sp.]|nr:hypothetical protein [Desulfobacula sp.]
MAHRNTPKRTGEILEPGVAASTLIEAGHMGAKNAGGFAVPASDTVGLIVLGRVENTVDNTGGANGDERVKILRKNAFAFKNSGTNPLSIADIGTNAYVEDSETVTNAAGATNDIVAGKILDVDSEGVWVEIQ